MPRRYSEPEYRRRIREKAEQHKREAENKERGTAEKSYIEHVASAIHRIEQELNRANNENAPEKKRDRYWERGGIVGLCAAAAVGISAIWIGTHDADKQRSVMESQLVAM